MYTAFFGLNDKPFSITPDPRYIYMSARHREALAHLNFGVTEGNGFVLLSGEVGTGKTTSVWAASRAGASRRFTAPKVRAKRPCAGPWWETCPSTSNWR